MSTLSLVIILAVLAIAAMAVAVFLRMRTIATPTTGPHIDRQARPNPALLVIDVQEDFTSVGGRHGWDEDYLASHMAAINAATAQARAAGIPVIAVRHVFKGWIANTLVRLVGEGRGCENSGGLGFSPRLDIVPDKEIVKSLSDTFSSTEFERFLAERAIGRLTLVGLDGSFCVQNTANGALNRGYDVTILEAAVLSHEEKQWQNHRDRLQQRGAIIA